jgi:hypothetical protein
VKPNHLIFILGLNTLISPPSTTGAQITGDTNLGAR